MDKLIKEIETALNKDEYKDNLSILLTKIKKIKKRFDKVINQSDKQQLQVLKLKEEIEERNKKIKLLLDNSGEGFLTFSKNMLIDKEYSKTAKEIFNQKIENKNITTLLYPNNIKKAKFLEETLKDIIDSNPLKQEVLLSLLPTEFKIGNRIIYIKYKIIDDKFMLILNDITEKKELQKKAKKEAQILKMVVDFVTSTEQFREIQKEYINLAQNIENYKQDISFLKMKIHTFKGIFAQKEMINIVEKLHQFETDIENNNINISSKDMVEWLEEDIKIIKNVLGEEYFKEYIKIKKEKIDSIFAKLKYLNNFDILNDIYNLKNINIKSYLNSYKDLVKNLAIKLEKEINIIFEIEEIYLSKRFIPFLNSLVHMFRNSVDHGIDEYGEIKFQVKQESNNLIFSLYNTKEIDKKMIPFIFNEGFTTKEEITTISGRGIGLHSVKEEVKNLDGEIEIIAENGTTFKIIIPINNILEKLHTRINDYFNLELKKTDFIDTENYSLINIYGELNGIVYLGINDKLGKKLTFDLGDEYIQDAVDEFLNTIIGNILKFYDLEISVPYKENIKLDTKFSLIYDTYIISIGFKG